MATTKKTTTKRAGFKRTNSPTDSDLRAAFQIYVSAAVEAYRAEEKSIEEYATKDKAWGKEYGNKSINFFEMMLDGMKEYMGGEGTHLEGVCDNCGSSQQDCSCTKDDGVSWNDEDEDDE